MICNKCGHDNPNEYKFCMSCGAKFEQVEENTNVGVSSIPPAYQNSVADDGSAETTVLSDLNFTGNNPTTQTGYQSPFESSEPPKEEPKKSKKTLILILVISFVVIVLGLATTWFFLIFTPSQNFGKLIEDGDANAIVDQYEQDKNGFLMLPSMVEEQLMTYTKELGENIAKFKGTANEFMTNYDKLAVISQCSSEDISKVASDAIIAVASEKQNCEYMQTAQSKIANDEYMEGVKTYDLIPENSFLYEQAQKEREQAKEDFAEFLLSSTNDLKSILDYNNAAIVLYEGNKTASSKEVQAKYEEVSAKLVNYKDEVEKLEKEVNKMETSEQYKDITDRINALLEEIPEETSLKDLKDFANTLYENIEKKEQKEEFYKFIYDIRDADGAEEALAKLNLAYVAESMPDAMTEEDYQALLNELQESLSKPVSNDKIKSTTASSYYIEGTYSHKVENTIDAVTNTVWCNDIKKDGGSTGCWIEYKFDDVYAINKINILNGHCKSKDLYTKNSRAKRILLEFSNGYTIYCDLQDIALTWQIITLPNTVYSDSVKITVEEAFAGSSYKDMCISEVTFE